MSKKDDKKHNQKQNQKQGGSFEGAPGSSQGLEKQKFEKKTDQSQSYVFTLLSKIQNRLEKEGYKISPSAIKEQLFEWVTKYKDDSVFLRALGSMVGSDEKLKIDDIYNNSIPLNVLQGLDSRFYDDTLKQLTEENKWGLLSAYTVSVDIFLRKQGLKKSFVSYLKENDIDFPFYDTRTKQWESTENNAMPRWNYNYFSQLREGYISFIQGLDEKQGINKEKLLSYSISSTNLIEYLQHCPFTSLEDNKVSDNVTACLYKNNIFTEVPRIVEKLETTNHQQTVYKETFGGNIHRMVTQAYPLNDFYNSASGKHKKNIHFTPGERIQYTNPQGKLVQGEIVSKNTKGDTPAPGNIMIKLDQGTHFSVSRETLRNNQFLKPYYQWVLKQAEKKNDKAIVTIAATWLDLFDRGEKNFSDKYVEKLKKSVMKSLFEKKMDLLDSSGYEDNLRKLFQAQGLSNKKIDKMLDRYKQFWKDFFDLDCKKHYFSDIDGSSIEIIINKNLIFSPSKRNQATDLGDFFKFEIAYQPSKKQGSELIAKILGSEDTWGDRDRLERNDSTKKEILYPQKSQKYRMYGPNGEKKEGYLHFEIAEPLKSKGSDTAKDGDEEEPKFIAYMTPHLHKSNISDDSKEYIFGKDGKDSFANAVEGWKFDPIDDDGNIVDIQYTVTLNGGNDNRNESWKKHFVKIENFLIGKMLIDSGLDDTDHIDIEDYQGSEFDGSDFEEEDENQDNEEESEEGEDENNENEEESEEGEDENNEEDQDNADQDNADQDNADQEGGGPTTPGGPTIPPESPERLTSGFDKEYEKLPGDKSVAMKGPKEGDILFGKDSSSNWPGGKSDWMKLEVTKVTDHEVTVKLAGHTEKDADKYIGKTKTLPRTEKGFEALNKLSKGKLFVYRGVTSKNDLFSYAGSDGLDIGKLWGGVKNGKKSYKIGGKSKTGAVTHVAKLPNQLSQNELQGATYEVKWGSNGVTLTSYLTKETDDDGQPTRQEKIVTTMDYTSFLHFCNDKELEPYTKEEIDNSGKHKTKNAENDPQFNNWRDTHVSINMIIGMLKKIPETFNAKREKDKELQSVLLLNGFLQAIPEGIDGGWLYVDAMRFDAEAEKDARIMQIINDFKDRLGRNDIGDGIHGGKGVEIIEKEIFEKNLTLRTDRLKAAGYLLYALENGGQPYPRKLNKYVGSGIWVKKLLGEEYQQDFLDEYQKLLDQYDSGGKSNIELQDRIAKAELRYIKDKTMDHPFYGSRFGRAVEGHMDNRGKANDLDKVKNGIAGKGNFYDIYTAIWGGGMGNLLPHVFMGGLLALEEAVETDEHYKMFYQVVVAALASGYTKQFSKKYINTFQGMCRRRGIPLGMFVNDGGSMTKSVGLIDYIAKENGIDSLYETIKSKTGGERDPRDPKLPGKDKMDVRTFNTGLTGNGGSKMARKVMSIVGDWWQVNGEKVMSEFNADPDTLLKGLAENNQYVTDYFSDDIVFDSYGDYKEGRTADMGDGESPFHNGIFNLNPGVFESYMLNYRGRNFHANQSADMRQQLQTTISSFGSKMREMDGSQKIPLLRVLLKKWKLYFGKKIGEDGLNYMKKQLLSSESTDMISQNLEKLNEISFKGQHRYSLDTQRLVISTNSHRNNYGYEPEAPYILSKTVNDYKDILVDGLALISQDEKNKLVNEVFDKND